MRFTFLFLQLLLQIRKSSQVTEGRLFDRRLRFFDGPSGAVAFFLFFLTNLNFGFAFHIFAVAEVGYQDALIIAVKFDDFYGQFLFHFGQLAIFLTDVLNRSEGFQAVGQLYDGATVVAADDGRGVVRTNGEYIFESIPGVLFQLLMAEGKLAVILIDLEDDDIDRLTYLSEF